MKLTGLSLALALALFSGQAAFAATAPTASLPQVESHVVTGSNALTAYNSWVSAWTSVFNTVYGSGNWTLDKEGDLSKKLFGAQFSTNATLADDTPVYSQGFLRLNNTVTYNLPKAVPGPEAGAGIGAAALLVGAYMLRRRQANRVEA